MNGLVNVSTVVSHWGYLPIRLDSAEERGERDWGGSSLESALPHELTDGLAEIHRTVQPECLRGPHMPPPES